MKEMIENILLQNSRSPKDLNFVYSLTLTLLQVDQIIITYFIKPS